MLKHYAIWDRTTDIITPIGEVLTPAKWMERHPITAIPNLTPVCAAGAINGAFMGILEEMQRIAENAGYDFSDCTTNEEKLERYELFEEQSNMKDPNYISDETRIADALQDLVVLNMPAE